MLSICATSHQANLKTRGEGAASLQKHVLCGVEPCARPETRRITGVQKSFSARKRRETGEKGEGKKEEGGKINGAASECGFAISRSPIRLTAWAVASARCNSCSSSARRMSSLSARILNRISWMAISAIFTFSRFSSVCNTSRSVVIGRRATAGRYNRAINVLPAGAASAGDSTRSSAVPIEPARPCRGDPITSRFRAGCAVPWPRDWIRPAADPANSLRIPHGFSIPPAISRCATASPNPERPGRKPGLVAVVEVEEEGKEAEERRRNLLSGCPHRIRSSSPSTRFRSTRRTWTPKRTIPSSQTPISGVLQPRPLSR